MDFGIIVDGAVIIVENIFSPAPWPVAEIDRDRESNGYDRDSGGGETDAVSMLIIIAAHIPIFTLQRHEGRIFAPMAYSVTSALIGSFIVSLTFVPLMCLRLLRGRLPDRENPKCGGANPFIDRSRVGARPRRC